LGMDAIAKSTGVEPAVHLVLAYFKDNFTHNRSLLRCRHLRKSDC
jgi:hypothetical protein